MKRLPAILLFLSFMILPVGYAGADSQTLTAINGAQDFNYQEAVANYFQRILDAGLNYIYNTKLVVGGKTIPSGYVKPIVVFQKSPQILTVTLLGKYENDTEIKKIFETTGKLLMSFNEQTRETYGIDVATNNVDLIYKDVDNFDTVADLKSGVYTNYMQNPFNAENGK